MAFNIVSLREDVSLGFGLDFRTSRDNVSEAVSIQSYMRANNIDGNEKSIADELSNEFYTFNSSPVDVQISSTDAGDAQTVTVYYFEDSSSDEPTSENVVLNGQTAVTLSNQMYRIYRMIVVGSGSVNAGDVYLSVDGEPLSSGKPTGNILSSMAAGNGFSSHSYIYVPSSWTGYLINQTIVSNCSDANNLTARIYGKRIPNPLSLTSIYQAQRTLVVTPFLSNQLNTPARLTQNGLIHYTVQRVNGASDVELECLFDWVLLR